MKLLLALAWFCAAGAASGRTAFQARCEDTLASTAAQLSARQNGYRIDHSLSYRTLTRMKGPAAAGTVVLGLTRTESRVTIGVNGPLLSDPPTAYECVAPRVEVSLSFLPIVIYVGKEFPPGSCLYQEILAHEMRHLNTYLGYLPKVETGVRAALNKRFIARPLYAPAGRARALLQQEIDGGWMPYIKSEMGKVETLQAAIDTPQEYSRLSKVCRGEVQSFIRPARETRS